MEGCNQTEMPKWKCHKEVHADKITAIDIFHNRVTLKLQNGFVNVDISYITKHAPVVGGYYVVYEDGYRSFSPAKTFENGYSLVSECADECEN